LTFIRNRNIIIEEIERDEEKKMVQTQFMINITEPMISAVINDVGGFPGENNGNNKISAIKELRTRYGIGLREAKELIETVMIPKQEYRRVTEVVDYVMAYSADEAWDMPLTTQPTSDVGITRRYTANLKEVDHVAIMGGLLTPVFRTNVSSRVRIVENE
tara:strand:- start:1232 stop:1711 length:480 start_codon:yes stop_codon:yes gene_type:complete